MSSAARVLDFIRLVAHPKPQPQIDKVDTSLRYTDILFGFVIKELFVRIQNWDQLELSVRLHLVMGTTLVLGSWIGYRRSQNRSSYEVKFFNLPFVRFALDQLMLILYFRIAVSTPMEGKLPSSPSGLAIHDLHLVLLIFGLYWVWDLLGISMTYTRLPPEPDSTSARRYPEITPEKKLGPNPQNADWPGSFITFGCLVLLLAMLLIANWVGSYGLLFGLTVLLLFYRWVKEIRTSWKSQQTA